MTDVFIMMVIIPTIVGTVASVVVVSMFCLLDRKHDVQPVTAAENVPVEDSEPEIEEEVMVENESRKPVILNGARRRRVLDRQKRESIAAYNIGGIDDGE